MTFLHARVAAILAGDLPPDIPGVIEWHLGSTKSYKMIHRPTCRHARKPYTWAGTRTVEELAEAITEAGWLAVEANRGCLLCSSDLERELGRLSAGLP